MFSRKEECWERRSRLHFSYLLSKLLLQASHACRDFIARCCLCWEVLQAGGESLAVVRLSLEPLKFLCVYFLSVYSSRETSSSSSLESPSAYLPAWEDGEVLLPLSFFPLREKAQMPWANLGSSPN